MSSSKIKVLHLVETLGLGGAERLIVYSLKNIDRHKFYPTVVCLFGDMNLGKELENADIPVLCLNIKNPYYWWQAIFELYQLIKKEKFDIIHTHLFFANIYGRIASKIAGVSNVITTLHNPDYTYEDNGKFSYKIRKLIDKYSGIICNRYFLAVSDFVKRDFEKNLGYKNIRVLYNCIDVTQFDRLVKLRVKDKRQELGFEDDDIIILNVGRLHPQKGQIYLIDAMNIIREVNKKCKLLIIGKGDMERELKSKANKMGLEKSIVFLKDRKDIAEIMNCCDIFVSTSLYEGFGIALVEAMSIGMPVVATIIETFKEILRDNIDGIMIEKENPEKLAKTILALIQDKEKRVFLGENARKRAIELFDVKVYIKNLENIYEESIY